MYHPLNHPLTNMDDHSADRLVECAKWFRHHLPDLADRPVPDAFETEREAVERMRDALLFEAHHAMQKSLPSPPDAPLSNAVDLRTSEPGLARLVRGEVVTTRGDAVVRPVDYKAGSAGGGGGEGGGEGGGGEGGGGGVDASAPPPSLPLPKLSKSMEAAERATARAHDRAERIAAESFMSKEERAAAAEERKQERAKNAEERRAAKQAKQDAKKDGEEENADGEEEEGDPPQKEEESAEAGANEDSEKGEGEGDAGEGKEGDGASSKKDAVEAEQSIPPMGPPPPPKRKRSGAEAAEFFASPAPHDRYLTALSESGLHPSIRGAVLRGDPSCDSVRVTHGPPGCGKTHALLDALQALHESSPDVRCLVAAPTNVGAADLYTRAFARGLIGCLALAKENMPPGVPRPRAVDLRSARFVFSTVAGRSGPRLNDERFHAVFLDEAGLCPESIVWGLLRPHVRFLWMVGDPRQLGAVTSEEGVQLGHQRSIMERLGAVGFPAEYLNVQRRMHPEIAAYPSSAFYDGSLVTDPSPPLPCPNVSPYSLVDVRSGSSSSSGTSFENVEEAKHACRVAAELKRHYPRTVLLTPYSAQLRRLRSYRSGVEAYTVDSFQGKEADAVVLSLVRTPGSGSGFWSDPRRLAVALTRAKHAMRVVCHSGWADSDPSSPLGALVSDARTRGAVVAVDT